MSFTFHKPITVVCFLLLYHIPPLFSIALRRPSRCFYMFGIQIPVDACSPFGLKRRSFLFVIDKKPPNFRRFCFLFVIFFFSRGHGSFVFEVGFPHVHAVALVDFANDFCRHSRDYAVWRHVPRHHRACRDDAVFAVERRNRKKSFAPIC